MLTSAPPTAMTNSRDAAEPRQSCAVDRDGPAGRRTYGFYNTIVGIGILVGYLATETLVQGLPMVVHPTLTWMGFCLIA